ncbi:hypothetical protein [Phytoactinopolyspora limicola]|uniref:hypothetical protein n=1 Tax=Phytoactinopolyspora limicola TaxID=2715536 RepID=UPI00140DF85F|nr:hypothetical protein [Phytoactinopolyspora limicola]
MKAHAITRSALTSFLALTCVLALATPGAAVAGDEDAEDQLPMSEEEFVAGAMEVGGLSEADARDAYHDPDVVLTVPVEVVAEDSVESETVDSPTIKATYRGCTLTARRDANNLAGHRLFRLTVEKYWEGNGSTVRNVSHDWSHSTTTLGRVGGWSFDRLTESVGEYRSWRGIARGRHYSARSGRWSAWPESRTLQARLMTRADGSWTTDRGDGKCW